MGGTVTASYLFGNTLVGKGGEVNLYDGRGSSRQTTDGGGSVTGSRVFEAFGGAVSSVGSGATYGYAATSGYRDDGDAGLTHVGARYYDAQVGRFTSRDTYLDQKPYTYCEGDPVNKVDPTGHKPPINWKEVGHWVWDAGFGFIGTIGGGILGGAAGALIGGATTVPIGGAGALPGGLLGEIIGGFIGILIGTAIGEILWQLFF